MTATQPLRCAAAIRDWWLEIRISAALWLAQAAPIDTRLASKRWARATELINQRSPAQIRRMRKAAEWAA